MPRTYGHKVGSKVVEDMLTVVDDLGVKYFTVYAFSTENWKRSTEEVSTLMTILRTYLKDCVKKSMKNNVRCRVIGRREELSADMIEMCIRDRHKENADNHQKKYDAKDKSQNEYPDGHHQGKKGSKDGKFFIKGQEIVDIDIKI